MTGLPRPDNFDNWCSNRDKKLDSYETSSQSQRHLPSNIALASDDLDDYGSWRQDNRYGDVWVPRTSRSDWRPYHDGHWVWVDPYGWTWVSEEPWGWAPYHYGSWIHEPYGWAWCPGPRHQYWSPGVVAYSSYGSSLAWAPLAPAEIVYPPALSIGFHSGDWSLFFSIGQAAAYYPTYYQGSRYAFVADPWQNRYVNRTVYLGDRTINNITINNYYGNQRNYLTNSRYVPLNVRSGGAVLADSRTFGRTDRFRTLSGAQAVTAFSNGRMLSRPKAGTGFAGPAIRPTALALAPNRTFKSNVRIPNAALSRPVYRTSLPTHIASSSTSPIRALPHSGARTSAIAPTATANRLPGGAPGRTPITTANAGRQTAAERAHQARAALGGGTRTAAVGPVNARGGPKPNATIGKGNPSNQTAAANRAAAANRVTANRTAAANRVAANRASAANKAAQARKATGANHIAKNGGGGTQHSPQAHVNKTAPPAHRQQTASHNTNRGGGQHVASQSHAAPKHTSSHARSEVGAGRKQVAENRPRPENRKFYRQQPPSDLGRQHTEKTYRQSAPRPVERQPRTVERQHRTTERKPTGHVNLPGGGKASDERGGSNRNKKHDRSGGNGKYD